MTIVRGIRFLLVAGLLGAMPGLATAAPEQIEVSDETLVRAGQATREELLFDLYQVSLYLPSKDAGMERITQQTVPKAFHVEVLYGGGMPEEIPEDWAEELLPPIPDPKVEELRQVFQNLEEGDELVITYAPGSGTTVRLNGETVFTDPGAELMAGMVDVFLGPDPVSENVSASLLGRAKEEGWLF
jgi:hypothetical protein